MVVVMVLGGGLPRTPAFTAGNPTAFSSPLAHAPMLCQNNRTANLLKIFHSLRCPKKQYKEPTKSWQPHQGQFHNRPVTQSRCGRYLAFERFMELLYTNQTRDREAVAAACASAAPCSAAPSTPHAFTSCSHLHVNGTYSLRVAHALV